MIRPSSIGFFVWTHRCFCLLLLGAFSLSMSGCGEGTVRDRRAKREDSRPADWNREPGENSVQYGSNSYPAQSKLKHVPIPQRSSADAKQKTRHRRPADREHERPEPANREQYDWVAENEYLDSLQNPQSTFSIDVDTASYANVRRMIQESQWPPKGAVRIEEFVNYFQYQYPQPENGEPFSVSMEISKCPWESKNQLLRIGLQGKEIPGAERSPANLVFLLDVSGSMAAQNKLPLVKESIKMLVRQLGKEDRISIVVYAGRSGVVLPPTVASNRERINLAIDQLQAGGSTNGAGGLDMAYKMAARHFVKGGTNRVLLCTDGDFNVGSTSQSELVDLIKKKAESGVFLSVFGFGRGNYNDSLMEKLADNGNGNYGYIDTRLEAYKVLVQQLSGTLFTIAKDVKIQVDFNPEYISAYRLIGYENRVMKNKDFKDDTKDAGEIGAGHRVTAIYELVPAGASARIPKSSGSRFVKNVVSPIMKNTRLVVAIRYKDPDGSVSQELNVPLSATRAAKEFDQCSTDFKFAASVAAFGMLLRDSRFKGSTSIDWIQQTAHENRGSDRYGFRGEFVSLVGKSRSMLDSGSAEISEDGFARYRD